MFNKLKTSLVQDMVKNGVIQEEDVELYCFGFDTLKTYLCAIVITLGIGLIMNSFWESIIYLISFKLLRTTAGGYHASTYSRCFVASSIVLVVSLGIVQYNNYFDLWFVAFLIIANICIVFLLAPLPDDNKPINEKERVYHRKKSRIVVLMESVVVIGMWFLDKGYSITILMADVTVTFLLLAWVIVRKLQLNRKNDSISES